MSGGHFDYDQYRIDQIAEDIAQIIRNNKNEELDEWGSKKGYFFPDEVIEEFKKAVKILDTAYVYVQRIDYLLSGDDGEKEFLSRLKDEIYNLETNKRSFTKGE